MVSADGRCVLSYNGEIYNTRTFGASSTAARRRPAAGADIPIPKCCSQAIVAWGLSRRSSSGVGMFALALWDRRSGR